MQKSFSGAQLIVVSISVLAMRGALAADPVFQNFFFDACDNPVGDLAVRCGETPGGTGDLSGNSESSLNPSQPLSSQAAALGRAREKTREASETIAELRDMDADKQQSGVSEAGALSIGPFSLLLNGRKTWFDQDRDDSDAERGLDGDIWAVELGFDYRLSDRTVVGGFVGYENTDADYDKDESGVNFTPQSDSGGIDADSYSFTLFGSYNLTENLFIEGSAGYSTTDYTFERNVVFQESTRTIAQTDVRAKADTDGEQYWASASMGYEFYRDAFSFGPYARVTYVKSTVDDYTENDTNNSGLEMRIDVDDRTSVTTDLGIGVSYAVSTSWGVLVPQARVEWEHEFDQDAQDITSLYVLDADRNQFSLEGDNPDRDYFNLGAGVSAIFPNGWMGFIDYEGLAGYEDLSRHRVTVGLRIEL
ncbi:autotransporter outer membrane beta-barrel domain-containing protein [Pseudomonadota bacterium]